ncbi:MAG TPA: PQQ-binding-like beta-propeller repeat protein [Lacipirellulaceae bacterium]|jgi:outer membrane protein assembly factor BamB|nr:PQQ-binding-like beta-propeller repeat protein [Lacipirellulaceae bacterium]
MRQLLLTLVFTFNGLILNVTAEDWPQWRGPARDGICKEQGLLREWPKDGPPLIWEQHDLGTGYSTPAIANGRIFLISNKGLDDEYVQALNEKDGKQIWTTHIGKVGNPDQQPNYPGARSTPTVDGDTVYALGSDGDLSCLSAGDGKVKWKKNLRTDFGGEPGVWAYSESPLVDGDALVVTPGGDEATMLKLYKKDGSVIWKGHPEPKKSDEDANAQPNKKQKRNAAGYSSIVKFNAAGKQQYIQLLGGGLIGVDAATGKFLWLYDRTSKGSPANIATPVCADDCVYSGTQYTGGGLIKLSPDGDGVKDEEVYFEKKLPRAIGGEVLHDGDLYGTSKEQTQCLDFKTGEVKWSKDHGIAPASLLYADNRLYLHGEEQGDVMLLEASPAGYKELGHFTPSDLPTDRVGKSWAYPVIANGRLYIHDWGKLWCFDLKANGGEKAASRPPAATTPSRN